MTDKIRRFMRRKPTAAFEQAHFFGLFLVAKQEMNK
jgi:hypothetical protein